MADNDSLLGGLVETITFPVEWYYKERAADEARARRKQDKELTLKELALKEEEIGLTEKERAFNRLLTLMAGSHKMTQAATSVSRLKALRRA